MTICTCDKVRETVENKNHDFDCRLWDVDEFFSGEEEWDGSLAQLVLSRTPWGMSDEREWNGDTPISLAEIVEARDEQDIVEIISELELEAIAAEDEYGADEHGFIRLPDDSYIDLENRVTYRCIRDDKNGKSWGEELWDDPIDTADVVYECTCTVGKTYYCTVCNLQRDTKDGPWYPWNPTATMPTSSYGSWSGCGHTFETFLLPGAQHENIKISGARAHTMTTTPDHGFYASNCWNPTCIATFIPWQDYGLPTAGYGATVEIIKTAWEMSCAGKVIEVGCMGGHGRTGTILGCLAILSDPEMTPADAVKWVRKVHCSKAIETNQQEWFIAYFAAMVRDTVCPPMPERYLTPVNDSWKQSADAAKTAGAAASPNGGGMTVMGPKAPTSPAAGPSTSPSKSGYGWCADCHREVKSMHNYGCPTEKRLFAEAVKAGVESRGGKDVDTAVLKFEPLASMPRGETANARRRNAKRANRRASARANKHAMINYREGD